ncbi:MAG: RrF2 family transcriptional regulator [Desulfatibacillaceae bacterium]
MRLTTRSRYGTRMVLDLARHGQDGLVRIEDIAKRQDISAKYLEKLVRQLKGPGYIRSRRGPNGGHALTRPPDQITIGEIVRVLEGSPALVECAENNGQCPRMHECVTHLAWMEVTKAMYEKLDSITVADLMAMEPPCDDSGFRKGASVG